MPAHVRERNDPEQYEDLAAVWWEPSGPFAMLHWIAEARARLIPVAPRPSSLLVDLGCGAGLLAPHILNRGYAHVGIDLSETALAQAEAHGMHGIQGDVCALPLDNAVADVVCAGEILEHVADLVSVVNEACRVLRPGGLLVLDTIADTRLARLMAVGLAERIPGGAPPGIHDPKLFVNRRHLTSLFARNGIPIRLTGLRPSAVSLAKWLGHRAPRARMVPTWS